MTFRDITKKNLKFNIRIFASFLFVNAFVVCVLFLFGSLLFNETLNEDAAIRAAQSLIVMATAGITVFSIIFLTYTGIYFTRSRGREFGVYLTLGMTARDLSRMATIESSVIFGAAATLGIAGAMLIGKLFYLALAKALGTDANLFSIGYGTFIYSIGVLVFTFIIQRWAAARFIRKLSIVEITKSSKTKGLSKQNPFVGIMAIFLFITSLVGFHAAVTGADWIISFVRNYMELTVITLVVTMMISMFFLIGSAITIVISILKRFPALYQRNILLLSGLSYKFRAYRVSLFSVTLLVAFAVFFIGIGMSLYIYGEMTIDLFQPHDFMIERRGEINNVSEYELREIIADVSGEIKNINTLPYLDGLVYRELNKRDGLFVSYQQNSFLVSESDFNNFTGQDINLEHDELLIVTNDENIAEDDISFNTVIVVEPFTQGIEREIAFRTASMDKNEFIQTLDGISYLEYSQENTTLLLFPFVNSHGSMEFIRSHANVVDDEVYASLIQQNNELISLELAMGDHIEVMNALVSALIVKNNLPENAWRDETELSFMDKDNVNWLRPISRMESHSILLRANGFLLFAMAFLGLLFLASSCIVLYYKLAADTDEETINISTFKKIGLTRYECRSYLQTHIAIIFFLPLLLGGVLGLYLTYQFLSNSVYAGLLVSRIAMMYGIIVIFAIALYSSLRKRFFNDVRV